VPQAIVFLTHRLNRSIRSQFDRLRREAAPYASAFLCVHVARFALLPDSAYQGDIVIRPKDGARLLPLRDAEMGERRKAKYNGGFPDLALMPALQHAKLTRFDPVWMVEYDADYAGDWGEFFRRTEGLEADLVTSHVRRRTEDDPDWAPWSWFAPPPDIRHSEQLASFNPVARYSRRFVATYLEAAASGRWRGHTEALYPTIANQAGLTIVDLGGTGSFVPAGWQNLNYTGRHASDRSGTFRYRPDIGQHYFHERPEDFALPGKLYHPVKAPGMNLRVLTRPLRRRFGRWRKMIRRQWQR
jgi:hypothetical protein